MPETFLINHPHKARKTLHIWKGAWNKGDTVCRMLSTGGMKLSKDHHFTWIINPETERVCVMCRNLSKLQQFRKELGTR